MNIHECYEAGPVPEEVVHAHNVIAFRVWAWPSGFCD